MPTLQAPIVIQQIIVNCATCFATQRSTSTGTRKRANNSSRKSPHSSTCGTSIPKRFCADFCTSECA